MELVVYKFIRASQTGDVNCLVKGELENVAANDGTSLQSLFESGWKLAAMTHLDTGFILLALEKA